MYNPYLPYTFDRVGRSTLRRIRWQLDSIRSTGHAWRISAQALLEPSSVGFAYFCMRWGRLGPYLWRARRIPSWTRGAEAVWLAQTSYALPANAVIVELGSFLGASALLLAGPRKLRGSGELHCVDPFDASGDPYSQTHYRAVRDSTPVSLRERFDDNIRSARLSDWVYVHQGRSAEVAVNWSKDIDMLFMDADQSYAAVREAFDHWSRFLKPGGVLAAHNSRPGLYREHHDGHMRLVQEYIQPPHFMNVQLVGTTTFARKSATRP